MKNQSVFGLFYLVAFLAIVPSACGAGSPGSQSFLGTPRLQSSMAPSAQTVKELLYVSDGIRYTVHVFNYQTGATLGTLRGFGNPSGECVDANGDVYIGSGSLNLIVEYAHGGNTPLQTLYLDGSPIACSISPKGDLAVANGRTPSGGGDVDIFRYASGGPSPYANASCYTLYGAGYDGAGNLYVQARSKANRSVVCELHKRTQELKVVKSNARIGLPAGVAWDGTHITLAGTYGSSPTAIYQMKESASGDLTVVGKTPLSEPACRYGPFVHLPFIVGTVNTPLNKHLATAVVGQPSGCGFGYWSYPKGGDPTKQLKVNIRGEGQAVSISP